MKIGNPLDKPGLVPVNKPGNPPADNSASASGASAPSGSTVALSTTATALMRSGGTTPAASAEFDNAKVERISGAISRGEFTVNPEVIADKLLANAQELLSPPH